MHQLVFIAFVAVGILLARAFRGQPPEPTSVDPAVIEAFRKIYLRQILLSVLVVPFIIWVFMWPHRGGSLHAPLLLVAGVVIGWMCLHTYRSWRCPKCSAYLGRNPMYKWQCPSCGTALREPRNS